jgi:hypothetical protein
MQADYLGGQQTTHVSQIMEFSMFIQEKEMTEDNIDRQAAACRRGPCNT